VVIGGLRLAYKLDSSDIRAVDIRSGKDYWWYHRHDRFLHDVTVDQDSGEVDILWQDKAGGSQSADRFSARTGKVIWHHDLPAPADNFPSGRDRIIIGGPGVGTVAFLDRLHLIGLGHDDGRRRWTMSEPPHCHAVTEPGLTTAEANVIVIVEECFEGPKIKGYLTGVDAGAGRRRWRLDLSQWSNSVIPFDPGQVLPYTNGRIVFSGKTGRPAHVIDAASGRVTAQGMGFNSDQILSDGVVVTKCSAGKRATGWCGFDFDTGRLLWKRSMAPPLDASASAILVRDGHVYVVGEHGGDPDDEPAQLGIIDPRRGTWLGRYPLPRFRDAKHPLDPAEAPMPADVREGVIVASTNGPYVLYVDPSARHESSPARGAAAARRLPVRSHPGQPGRGGGRDHQHIRAVGAGEGRLHPRRGAARLRLPRRRLA
jgi:outer membrane protein assembly factor BamB